jgi:energy-coupling factor transporter transmembrane protein EcfT
MIDSIDTVNSNTIYSIGNITSLLILIPLIIFIWLAIKSKNIKSFQFQLMVFILMYLVGQIIENNGDSVFFSVLPKDFGSQIHVIAAAFFTIMILFRFYYANPRKKKMVDNQRDGID